MRGLLSMLAAMGAIAPAKPRGSMKRPKRKGAKIRPKGKSR